MKNKAFTLIEVLVVMVIIGILIGLSVFGLGAVQKGARDGEKKNTLNQVGLAIEAAFNLNKTYPCLADCTGGGVYNVPHLSFIDQNIHSNNIYVSALIPRPRPAITIPPTTTPPPATGSYTCTPGINCSGAITQSGINSVDATLQPAKSSAGGWSDYFYQVYDGTSNDGVFEISVKLESPPARCTDGYVHYGGGVVSNSGTPLSFKDKYSSILKECWIN